MKNYTLTSEDLPPNQPTLADKLLTRELEIALNLHFEAAYRQQGKNSKLSSLLSQCKWYITTNTDMTTLNIECPNLALSWQILESILEIGDLLAKLVIGKICVSPPPDKGTPLVVRVDELSVYSYPQ